VWADLPAAQGAISSARMHLGSARDERLSTDVSSLAPPIRRSVAHYAPKGRFCRVEHP